MAIITNREQRLYRHLVSWYAAAPAPTLKGQADDGAARPLTLDTLEKSASEMLELYHNYNELYGTGRLDAEEAIQTLREMVKGLDAMVDAFANQVRNDASPPFSPSIKTSPFVVDNPFVIKSSRGSIWGEQPMNGYTNWQEEPPKGAVIPNGNILHVSGNIAGYTDITLQAVPNTDIGDYVIIGTTPDGKQYLFCSHCTQRLCVVCNRCHSCNGICTGKIPV